MNWRAFISGALIASLVLLFGFSETPKIVSAANQVVIYLTGNPGNGNQTFGVPADWNSSTNTIECIGSGGKAGSGATAAGGGGAYAKISNLTLTGGGTATYAIGQSATTSTNTGMWRETYFNGTASSSASISCAFGRSGATTGNGAGGSTANSTGTTKFAGGSGATQKGGGGAAGPNGAGGNGVGGSGGSGDNLLGGNGGESANASSEESCFVGGWGTEYSQGINSLSSAGAVGSGGGGGGGVVGFAAGCDGGFYGAGGGAGSPAGSGQQGIIIIFYTPSTSGFTGVLAKFKIQGGRVLIRGGRVLFK